MLLTERRRANPGEAARPRTPPWRRRRSDRVRRFTRAGVAAALAILSRHTGPDPTGEDAAHVEVETANFHIADQGRHALDALIEEAAAVHGLSPHLVRAVVQAESAFDPLAESPVGAQGLMQLMPATAARMGVKDRLDPRQNVFGGVKYLSQLLHRYDGDVALALAGYNAGPGKVARYRGMPPYAETRGYVTRIRGIMAATTGASFPLPAAEPRSGGTHRRPRRSAHGRRS